MIKDRNKADGHAIKKSSQFKIEIDEQMKCDKIMKYQSMKGRNTDRNKRKRQKLTKKAMGFI